MSFKVKARIHSKFSKKRGNFAFRGGNYLDDKR